MLRFLLPGLLAFSVSSASAHELDEAEIKRLAVEAIMERPEIILEAISVLQQREQQELLASAVEPGSAPIIGDPNAPITIIEFFDYNCGFCKRAADVMRPVLAENPDVRFVMREYPILSPGSVVAARAALAAQEQGKYEELHWALMEAPRVTEENTLEIAEELGLDMVRLRAEMASAQVDEHIQQTRDLAEALSVTGTPAFVIGNQLVAGFLDAEQFQELIEEARAN